MGEVIFLRQGLFGLRTAILVPRHGTATRAARSIARVVGRVGLCGWKLIRGITAVIWTLLLIVAMLPALALYSLVFLFALTLGFGILYEVGRAVGLVAN